MLRRILSWLWAPLAGLGAVLLGWFAVKGSARPTPATASPEAAGPLRKASEELDRQADRAAREDARVVEETKKLDPPGVLEGYKELAERWRRERAGRGPN